MDDTGKWYFVRELWTPSGDGKGLMKLLKIGVEKDIRLK